jgi:hypothetical protein
VEIEHLIEANTIDLQKPCAMGKSFNPAKVLGKIFTPYRI